MTLSFDLFPQTESVIHGLDPRWKLAAVLLAVIGIVFLQTLPAAAGALFLGVILVGISRLPARWYLTRVGVVAVFLALFAVSFLFIVQGTEGETWRLGPVSLSLP